ncbi:hypothetical protein [Streptomyces sp. NPDC047981]|uniref:hypothetical protein n=1 Tax=Streptomyces sp. NPDC047981 TaxID=3154610 RepID=UPI0034327810
MTRTRLGPLVAHLLALTLMLTGLASAAAAAAAPVAVPAPAAHPRTIAPTDLAKVRRLIDAPGTPG